MSPESSSESSSDDDEYDHQTNNVNLEYQLRRLDEMGNMIQQLHNPSPNEDDDPSDDVVINVPNNADS